MDGNLFAKIATFVNLNVCCEWTLVPAILIFCSHSILIIKHFSKFVIAYSLSCFIVLTLSLSIIVYQVGSTNPSTFDVIKSIEFPLKAFYINKNTSVINFYYLSIMRFCSLKIALILYLYWWICRINCIEKWNRIGKLKTKAWLKNGMFYDGQLL